MRVAIRRGSIRWIERVLFAGAFCLLGYCGFVLAAAWSFQNRERVAFEGQLKSAPSALDKVSLPAVNRRLIGRIEIRRLGVSAMVMEGTKWATLQRAVGHIEGTALPGAPGNVGLSGHRDTFFRPLRNIRADDRITLTTLHGEFNYRVVSTRIVDPSDVSVLDPSARETLTLVTCYPFYFVGSAPERFVVKAERSP